MSIGTAIACGFSLVCSVFGYGILVFGYGFSGMGFRVQGRGVRGSETSNHHDVRGEGSGLRQQVSTMTCGASVFWSVFWYDGIRVQEFGARSALPRPRKIAGPSCYRGSSLIRNNPLLGPYTRTLHYDHV